MESPEEMMAKYGWKRNQQKSKLSGWVPLNCSFTLDRNPHQSFCIGVRDYLEEEDRNNPGYHDFPSPGEREKACQEDELWVLHWYERGSVSFCTMCAASLGALLEAVNEGPNEP